MKSLFEWECFPEAEKLIQKTYAEAQAKNRTLHSFSEKLYAVTSTHLGQWVEALFLPIEEQETWKKAGFIGTSYQGDCEIYKHPEGQFPHLIFSERKGGGASHKKISISVEDLPFFCMVNGFYVNIEGAPFSRRRSCLISVEGEWGFEASDGLGEFTPIPEYLSHDEIVKRLSWKELLRQRHRMAIGVTEEAILLDVSCHFIQKMVVALGTGLAAALFLGVEREFWQSKNRAGQIQFARQNALGLGWANHDHHTFRSSRAHFQTAVRFFELLGFQCRERFWAGTEAGWGAQVLEHPFARGVIFLDVDLAPGEIDNDFAHTALPELNHLGTVGLWCALHGESLLNAGMHHLEAQFDFEKLERDLKGIGVGMMAPFSSFSYLKQAFTVGERWAVNPERVQYIVQKGFITPEMGEKFLRDGAIGSHLENLERKEGYKGFNKNNVSTIIKETDPRLY